MGQPPGAEGGVEKGGEWNWGQAEAARKGTKVPLPLECWALPWAWSGRPEKLREERAPHAGGRVDSHSDLPCSLLAGFLPSDVDGEGPDLCLI